MKNYIRKKYRIKLRFACISALILALLIGTWPVVVRAADDTTWQDNFLYTLDDTAQTITLNRWISNSSVNTFEVPSTAVIGGISYHSCLGDTQYTDPSDSETAIGVFQDARIAYLDLSQLDTSNTTSMRNLFRGCHLFNLDISSFDTSNVTDMSGMFYDCTYLYELNFSSFDTSKVTDMSYMFYSCSLYPNRYFDPLDLSSFDTSNVTDMSGMFSKCNIRSLNISSFDTSNVTNMKDMFRDCTYLNSLDVSTFDTHNVTDMSGMFYGLGNYSNYHFGVPFSGLDVSSFNTGNVADMSNMFAVITDLTTLDLSSFDTSNVTDMHGMFDHCTKLTSLNIDSFDTSNVIDMSYLFADCRSITTIDTEHLSTGKVTNMSHMFSHCEALTSLDVSTFDSAQVTDMSYMFSDCRSLASLDLSNFHTENVSSIGYMFDGCSGLTSLDLTGFSTVGITGQPNRRLSALFRNCSSLTELDLSSMDFSNLNFDAGTTLPGNIFDNTNLDVIYSPTNLISRLVVPLPYRYRALETGTVYSNLPRNNSNSLTLVRYDPDAVESVSLSDTSLDMFTGDTEQLVATVLPTTAVDKSVTWTSANPAIATVDDSGLVTAVAEGETDITVTTTDGGYTAVCHVTVTRAPVPVTGVTLNTTSHIMPVSDTYQLQATVTPDNADDKSVSWTSADPAIATVNDSGLVTAIAEGETDITVRTTDGGYTAICHVTVTPSSVAVTGVTVQPTTLTMEVGDTASLNVTVLPTDAGNKNITFSSNNTAVATVDENGVITAVSTGGAAITVTTEDGGHTATCIVIVVPRTTPAVDVTGVSLTPVSLSMVVGDTEKLTATVLPANATNKSVTYTSSNPSVATVGADGTVTAISPGNTTITVTTADGGKTDTCLVTVTAAPVSVEDVALNRNTLSMTVGDQETLVATITPTNATNKSVSYTSSDPSVARVDTNGVVTAISPGSAVITVTTADGRKTDTCAVTVLAPAPTDLLTVIDRRTDATNTNQSAAAVTSLTEPLTLLITSTDGTALRTALTADDEIDQISTFRLEMKDAAGNDTSSYGACTVTMPLPLNFITDSGSIKAYYKNQNGVLTSVDSVRIFSSGDGTKMVSFHVPEMTEYALVHSKRETTPVTPDDPDNGNNNPSDQTDQNTQPIINVNVPEITVNVPTPEVTVNAPDVTVTAPPVNVSVNPSGASVGNGASGATASSPSNVSYNATDMPRTGYQHPYRTIIVILLFLSGSVMVILSIEPS